MSSSNNVRLARAAWLLPALCFVSGLALILALQPVGPFFIPFGFIAAPVWLLLVIVAFVYASVLAYKAGRSWRTVLLVISVPVASASIVLLEPPLESSLEARYFRDHQIRYEEIVIRLERGEPLDKPSGVYGGVSYIVDSGQPLRVAFPWPGGILDNWFGAVYDPTGFVMRSNEFRGDGSNWDDRRLAPVQNLFDGDMTGCSELGGSWYICSFT